MIPNLANPSQISQDEINAILWKACDTFRGTVDPSEYKNYILVMLFLKYISDVWLDKEAHYKEQFGEDEERLRRRMGRERFVLPDGADYYSIYEQRGEKNLGEIIDIALAAIEETNIEKLQGLFRNISFNPEAPLGQPKMRNERLKKLLEILANPKLDFLTGGFSGGEIFEFLIEKFPHAEGKRGGEYYSPKSIIKLMLDIAEPQSGMRIYDPAMGTGGMLVQANEWVKENEKRDGNISLYGQDISEEAIFLSRMNLLFHQIFDATIFSGDTLLHPQNIEGENLQKFDLILSNPPFGLRLGEHQVSELRNDPFNRFIYGSPSSTADFAFLQHIIASLSETGKAIVAVPSRVLFASGQDGEIRKEILEDDLIEAVISLAPALLSNTAIPMNLLILNRAKSASQKGEVLFINASTEYERADRHRNTITQEQITKIKNIYQSHKEVKSFSHIAKLDDIRQQEFNLLPLRYIDLIDISNFLGGNVEWLPISKIAEIFPGSQIHRDAQGQGEIAIIKAANILNSRLQVTELDVIPLPEDTSRILFSQQGDILISRIGNKKFNLFYVEEGFDGAIVHQSLYVIRVEKAYHYLRKYIVEFFRSEKGQAILTKNIINMGAALSLRKSDLLRIKLPVPANRVIDLLGKLHAVEEKLLERVEQAQNMRADLFNIDNPNTVHTRLEELSTGAHVLSSSLVQSDTLEYQVRNFYPFPIAFSYRTLNSIHEISEKYTEQLRVAENLLAFLANIGIALCQASKVLQSDKNKNLTATSLIEKFGGGISPGDWQSMAYSSGVLLKEVDDYALAKSFSSLWFKGTGRKASAFTKDTNRLAVLKNDHKHDRGPKISSEYEKYSTEVQTILDRCYEALSFMVKYPMRSMEALDIDWRTKDAVLDTLVYIGDHPGLRKERVSYHEPLPKGLLYLELQKDIWIPLYPFISVQICPSCKTRETYFVDRWDHSGSKVKLKSFERSHIHESNEDAKKVAEDMQEWITDNLKVQ
ncbi:MAG: N-6 DNA methylase [Anaerolineae bacterium]|jgi:type I restriction enzyme M protein|nr:N-6 DNA methylase [Anaerolineae bacterium]MBT4310718.1 N-6 DNA methylase [Anaerolineae bacterium]MBT6063109.1 N-6 DNA methylase [Anaerolineae bacterium]MBT6321768.1 N-6 DNA methylase [Anaerolineae bacterium]MBT6812948.1 N-6 DNA methylase [Anaerolineae bacterium]